MVAAHRSVVVGGAEGEHAAVGRDEPVAAAAGFYGDPGGARQADGQRRSDDRGGVPRAAGGNGDGSESQQGNRGRGGLAVACDVHGFLLRVRHLGRRVARQVVSARGASEVFLGRRRRLFAPAGRNVQCEGVRTRGTRSRAGRAQSRGALANLARSAAPTPVALMPRALMLMSQPSAWCRSAPTVQFSLPSTENGS